MVPGILRGVGGIGLMADEPFSVSVSRRGKTIVTIALRPSIESELDVTSR